MEIDKLTDNDIGRRVKYIWKNQEITQGNILSIDRRYGYIFVKYDGPIENLLAQAANEGRGISTLPEDLEFVA